VVHKKTQSLKQCKPLAPKSPAKRGHWDSRLKSDRDNWQLDIAAKIRSKAG